MSLPLDFSCSVTSQPISVDTPFTSVDFQSLSTPRQSTRVRQALSYLKDFHCNLLSSCSAQTFSKETDLAKAGQPYRISNHLSYHHFSPNHFILSISITSEPKNLLQASKDPQWCEAMEAELKALEETKTWTLINLPPGKDAIHCKWVYMIKYKDDDAGTR